MAEQKFSTEPNSWLKQLQTLFFAFLCGLLMCTATIYFIHEGETVFDFSTGGIFIWLSILLFITCLSLAFLFFSTKLKSVRKISDIEIRMAEYRKISIIRLALIEGATLICVIFFMLSGNLFFLCIAFLCIFVFIFLRPSKSMVLSDLDKDDLVKDYLGA